MIGKVDTAGPGLNHTTTAKLKRKRFVSDRVVPFLLLMPSFIATLLFVYAFIAWTVYVSFSNWDSVSIDLSFAGITNYINLFNDFRFLSGIRNNIVITVLFVAASIVMGIVLALAIDSKIKGEAFFRNLFIFPMAISSIVAGVVWQWLLNPTSGYNNILKALGVEDLPMWYISEQVLFSFPFRDVQFGIPVALFSVLLAICWQMTGFVMAMFLSGLRAIPDDYREAARLDGASELQIFWLVILPLLRPVMVSVVVMIGHISLKIFDLIYAMTGPGSAFMTDMPGVYMFETTFRGNHYGSGAAIATIILFCVSILIVPYLISQRRQEVDGR